MDETKEPKDTELNPEEDVNAEEALADGSAEADGSVAPRVARGGYVVPDLADETVRRQLSGMYQNWFLDYASYVILDRAVPHLYDGFKPVQRRVLYSMKRKEDGRYNKVANIVGDTMHFHPHGDASIYSALVQLGQKDFLIDCQGNWGNILTGDDAAAPRYIEARLSKFALDVVFNEKTTEWQLSYDGRNREPVTLPVKFPLLLVQGVEGIAVGLQTKILPHNFNEVADAAIAYLKNEPFALYPDFPTGGSVDVSRYNDGRNRGKVKIRAKINKVDAKTLCITEIPYGTTTRKLIESIVRANEKGKIQIKKVDDNTAANVEIVIQLAPGRSSDKTIDALYAFTDCEMSVSPNCCVIYERKPHFMSVSDVLRFSTDNTLRLLKEELLIRKAELQESIFYMSLEKIFIRERMYKDKAFEQCKSEQEFFQFIDQRMEPFKSSFIRDVEEDDYRRLLQIKTVRYLKYSIDEVEEDIAEAQQQLKEVNDHLEHIVEYTIHWFESLKEKYGARYPRRTELRNFDTIEVAKVVEANEKLYINREEGFIGIGLKKDEFVCPCSDLDDIIVFYKDGRFKVIKVAEKVYVGKDVLYLNVFKKNDLRTIYNVVYRNGKDRVSYIKRFAVTSVTRDKEYNLTQGTPGTKVTYFSANPNGEAEVLKIYLRPQIRLKKLVFERDFSELAVKGRSAMGNILTKNDIQRIAVKSRGGSTLGGRQVWFDADVNRLNYDGRGRLLGEFFSEDAVLVVTKRGTWFTTSFDPSNHYPDDILVLEKFDAGKVWTAVLFDADQGYHYMKRFNLEASTKERGFLGDNPGSRLLLLSSEFYPRFRVTLAGGDEARGPIDIEADDFIAVKGYTAKGKRITTYAWGGIEELEPLRRPEPEEETPSDEADGGAEPEPNGEFRPDDDGSGQLSLF